MEDLLLIFAPMPALILTGMDAGAAVTALSALLGGIGGAWLLKRVNETYLKMGVVAIELLLTIGLFVQAP